MDLSYLHVYIEVARDYCTHNKVAPCEVGPPSLPTLPPLHSLIWRGWRKDLEYSDLTDLNSQDKSAVVAGNFQKSWESEVHRTQYVRIYTFTFTLLAR